MVFRADEADVSLDLREAELRGRVVVDAGRVKLRAERVRVVRRDDGAVEVDGPVVASACACDPPPVSLQARRFVVGSGGDVRATDVALRVLDTRVLSLPWLSLRAPTQAGLLPPTLAWRAADGPFAGLGAHVPLGRAGSLQLHAGGYVRGTGADTVATLDVGAARLRARWERLHGDRVALAGRASSSGSEAVQASIDVVRGPGVASAFLDVDSAARPRDRVDVAVSAAGAGASLFAYAPRGDGAAWTGVRVVAPLTLASRATSLSVVGDALSLTSSGRAVSAARADVRASAGGFIGPARVDARASVAGWVSTDESGAGASGGAATVVAGAGAPVARRFGGWVHVVEPGVRAAAVFVDERGGGAPMSPAPAARGGAAALSSPLSTWLGPPGRGVVSAELDPGVLARSDGVVVAARGRVGARGALVRGDAEGAIVARRAAWISRGELGPRALFARLSVEALEGADPVEARALGLEPSSRVRWLSAPGTTTRAGLGASRGDWYADASRTWSLPSGVALADEARVGWRPRCACVEVGALGARRLGRDGVDVLVQASLFR